MRILRNIFLVFLFVFQLNCKSDEDIINIPDPDLTENIEIYNGSLIENNYTFAIENGGLISYLIDKAGNKVKEWQFDTKLGNDLELLPQGKLIGIFKSDNPSITFGGYGGIIKILNNNGSINWEYNYSSEDYISHHDFELLPNGNVLFIAWEKIDTIEAQANGVITSIPVYPETLIEVNPSSNQIVWKWRSFNHIVQDIDSNLSNFGNVSENPQLIDINYNTALNGDIMHANGIDYDSVKDIIYLSVNKYSEVWVIDHSTTILEAESDSGGIYNKGGDLLYRFGNPTAYKNLQGTRMFYNNHFPNLLEDNEPGVDNVLVFNNGVNNGQSIIYELDIPDNFNLYPNMDNEPNIVWSFTDPNLFFGRISGAVRLKNGNTLIAEGDYGFWEVTSNGEIVWKYNGLESKFWRFYAYYFDDDEIIDLNLE